MATDAEIGRIEISDEVIGTIAGIAVSEIPGIAGMKGGLFEDIRQATTGKKKFSAGIRVDRDNENDSFSIDLDIIIDYDVKVTDVARKAQEIVKTKIESITGKAVSGVNIHIADIRLPENLLVAPKTED